MKHKIWSRLFGQITIIFAVFVLIITLANGTLLYRYFVWNEKRSLVNAAEQIETLDISDSDTLTTALEKTEGQLNFVIEIRDKSGSLVYTTYGHQLWNIRDQNQNMFGLEQRRKFRTLESTDYADGVISTVIDDSSESEYLMYSVKFDSGYTAEIRVQQQIMENSATIASQFVFYVAICCLILSIIWVILYAKKFSKPIVEMNVIAKDMADLKFDRKIRVTTKDEIGQLAVSINDLSEKLDTTLSDLRKSNAQLRNEIELERQIDVMRKGFVANVSHELKTPISIIQGYAEGLKLGVGEDPSAYCDIIIEESTRMNKMVLSLLELSRYESGQTKLNMESFDLSEICCSLCRKMSKKAEENNTKILFESDRPMMANADIDQVEQVLQNYLSNAISHVNTGGKVAVRITKQNGKLRTEVFNTGKNIPEGEMDQLWQSFYRSDPSRRREESRFGLGLSIVRSIMELHGQKYGVYNTEDGVCFWFELDEAVQK